MADNIAKSVQAISAAIAVSLVAMFVTQCEASLPSRYTLQLECMKQRGEWKKSPEWFGNEGCHFRADKPSQ